MIEDIWVKRFIEEALPKLRIEFNPQKVLFFGSLIRGDPRKDSDLDVIIVSEFFNNIPFVNRMGLVLKKVKFPKHIDYFCYTPEEFQKIRNQSSVIIDALEYAETINF
ncbi:MAG: nucleotidyltransferase domain-containing protein [Promethearchaeota archaeon]|nr:MAG: nucleotidyltransferase domain-containing protein [Candidatus Lokiarchaeota archaeon]